MLCLNPYRIKDGEFGCGKCLPCRFTKRRVWVGRLMLELQCHRYSCFVTLTYKEAEDGFRKDHIRDMLQKLRRKVGPVRYLVVGERGKLSGRIHYHMALFGVSAGEHGLLAEVWRHGFVDVGDLTGGSATYLVKYLLKPSGGEKPFRLMSNKPGIGAGPKGILVEQIAARVGPLLRSEVIEDVPQSIKGAEGVFPLSRYIRSKARVASGYSGLTPEVVRKRQSAEYALEDAAVRENKRCNAYASACARLAVINSKEKLK